LIELTWINEERKGENDTAQNLRGMRHVSSGTSIG